MKFGTGLFSMQRHPENPASNAEIYSNTLSQVKLAEKVNFDSAWIISMYRYYFSLGVKLFVRGKELTGLDDRFSIFCTKTV